MNTLAYNISDEQLDSQGLSESSMELVDKLNYSNKIKNIIFSASNKQDTLLKRYFGYISFIPKNILDDLSEKDIYCFLIKMDCNIFLNAPDNIQNDIEIKKAYIQGLYNAQYYIDDIIDIIKISFFSNFNILMNHLDNIIDRRFKYCKKDLSVLLPFIKINNKNFIINLDKKGVFEKKEFTIEISKSFLNDFYEYVKEKEDIKDLFHELNSYLGINSLYIGEDETFIINTIIDLLEIEKLKKLIFTQKQEKEENNEELNAIITEEDVEENVDITFEDFGMDVYPNSFIIQEGLNYQIFLPFTDTPLSISKEESETLTSKSFVNLVEFYKLLSEGKLEFLLNKKYKEDFSLFLLNYKNYRLSEGSGINNAKAIEIINYIWIQLILNCGNDVNRGEIHTRRDIQDTLGKISLSQGSNSFFESFLNQKGVLDMHSGGLNQEQWEKAA